MLSKIGQKWKNKLHLIMQHGQWCVCFGEHSIPSSADVPDADKAATLTAPTLPITWDALSTSVLSAALPYGHHQSCSHRGKPSTGNWSKIREAVVSEPVTGIFLPSKPVPFLLYWADHTFQTRMCWPHPETKGHTGLIHRVERLPCSKPCNNAFWSEKDSNGGDRREGKETTYQQEPRWTELNTGSLAFRKGKFVAAFPAMGLWGQTLFSQQKRPLSAFLAAGTACLKAQSSKRTLHFRGLASTLACWELRVVERNEARNGKGACEI